MNRPDEQRVVVTGMGVLTTVGVGVEPFVDGLIAGRSGITAWKREWGPDLLSRIGGDLSDFDALGWLAHADLTGSERKRVKKILRNAHFASRAAAIVGVQAFTQSGLAGMLPSDRIGQVAAAHNVCVPYIAEGVRTYDEVPDYIEPLFGMMCLDTDVVAVTTDVLQLRGPSYTVGGACASGNVAVISAMDLIRAGRTDAVVVTGVPIPMEPVALQGWAFIEALTYRSFNAEPERGSRPFDHRREGFVPAEGAAAVVLESLACARRRGAPILAEILGGAMTADADRMTRPHREGQARAMQLALADARLDAERIDYVNAHATSTPLGDRVEIDALRSVFGERLPGIPVNATKSMTGHCLTAAGVVELVAVIGQMQRGILHPTINQERTDLAIDCVPNVAREHAVGVALSNSFGFGGINSCVVVGRP